MVRPRGITNDEELFETLPPLDLETPSNCYCFVSVKCYEIKVEKQKVELRVEHEPDNISDSNALKFEVNFEGQRFIIGYCGVKKIPKLKRAPNVDKLCLWNFAIYEGYDIP